MKLHITFAGASTSCGVASDDAPLGHHGPDDELGTAECIVFPAPIGWRGDEPASLYDAAARAFLVIGSVIESAINAVVEARMAKAAGVWRQEGRPLTELETEAFGVIRASAHICGLTHVDHSVEIGNVRICLLEKLGSLPYVGVYLNGEQVASVAPAAPNQIDLGWVGRRVDIA